MRSGGAHCDLALAVDQDQEAKKEAEDEEASQRGTVLINSSNPHLAGGEQTNTQKLKGSEARFQIMFVKQNKHLI